MKIVHAVYSLEMGGAEVLVSQLCRIQRATGHDVSIVLYSALGVLGEALQAEGFDIRVLGTAHPLITIRRYYQHLRRVRPDVLHCHNVASTIQAAPAGRIARIPKIVSTRHGFQLQPYDTAQELKYNLAGWFCDWVVGICEFTATSIRAGRFARKRRVVMVYNGSEPVQRVDASALGKRGTTLLFVGRLAQIKDLGTLLRGAALARGRGLEFELWMVGDGPERQRLESLARALNISSSVRFFGQQSDTAPFFSAADIFCMSSVSEGLPMSLLQSMSLGTPAILTDVGGMGEVLRLTGGGLLVPVGDSAAFAEAIGSLAGDPPLHAQLSTRAEEAYRTRFTLETMSDGYLRLYNS